MKLKNILILFLIAIFFVGCGKKEDKVIKIGVILPLSGDRGAYGKSSKNGIDLAIEEINNSSKIYKIKPVYEDTKSQSRDAVSSIEKIISTDKVKIIIGPISSSEVLAIAPIAERNKIVLLSPGASSPEITKAGDYIFRNVPSDLYEGALMAKFAFDSLKLKNIYIVFINTDYGIGVEETFRNKFKTLGGVILQSISYNDGTRDFRSIALKLKQNKANAIYLIGYKEMGLIVKQFRELGIKTRFISTAVFEDPDILKTAGKLAEGIVFTSITFDPDSTNIHARKFVNSFKNNYNTIPDGYAAVAYDAVYMIWQSLESIKFDQNKIKEQLYKLKNFEGLLGKFSVDNNGDVLLPIKLKKVRNNKFIKY